MVLNFSIRYCEIVIKLFVYIAFRNLCNLAEQNVFMGKHGKHHPASGFYKVQTGSIDSHISERPEGEVCCNFRHARASLRLRANELDAQKGANIKWNAIAF